LASRLAFACGYVVLKKIWLVLYILLQQSVNTNYFGTYSEDVDDKDEDDDDAQLEGAYAVVLVTQAPFPFLLFAVGGPLEVQELVGA
jgi:hypothetical protein